MKEKIKNIVVAPNKDYVIWEEKLENIVRDTTLNVETGCLALYVVNGALKSTNFAGRWVINSKEDEKSKSRLQLICANTDRTFDICCGVGRIPYKDFELNLETIVGAHGECKIKIPQPWKLYTTLGHAEITAEEIDTYVKAKLAEIMTSRLSEVLQHYDYDNIMTQQSTIAEDLEKKFAEKLTDIGIEVCSFALAGFLFQDEYADQRKAYFDAQNQKKAEKEERKLKQRETRAEIENVIAIANATKDLNPTAGNGNQPPINANPNQPTQFDNQTNQPVKYCPRCGTKTVASSVFCPGCGQKF